MSKVDYAKLVEVILIVVTSTLLSQPRLLFPAGAARLRIAATWSGWMLLCLTFCWSVILGIVLTLHGITVQL